MFNAMIDLYGRAFRLRSSSRFAPGTAAVQGGLVPDPADRCLHAQPGRFV